MKFNYSTKLNPSEKTSINRVSLVASGLMLSIIDGKRTFFNVDTDTLPFTEAIRKAYAVVANGSELEYFNIGKKPTAAFTLEEPDLLHINYTMFLYAMHGAAARHVWNSRTQPKYFTSYVREDIMSSLYIQRLKVTTLQALLNDWTPQANMRQIIELYKQQGFPAGTATMYMLYWNSGEALKTLQLLLKTGEPFILDFESLLEEANLVVAESNLESLAKYKAHRKLMFLAASNRYEPNDFAAELLNRSRQGYIHCRPFLTRQHSLNYARQIINTYFMRIIEHYQHPDRARLLSDGQGQYDNRCVSYNPEVYAHLSSDDNVEDRWIAAIDERRELLGI